MKHSFLLGVVSVILIGSLFAGTRKLVLFKGEDITNAEIIGVLNKPLGTICKIQGVAEKDPGIHNKGYDPETVLLQVQTVDGASLAGPVFYNVREVRGLDNPPAAGAEFTLLVYESGSFVGPLADPNQLLGNTKDFGAVQTNDPNFSRYHLKIDLNVAKPK